MGKKIFNSIKEQFKDSIFVKILSGVAIILLVASFVLPPLAIVDSSVIEACWCIWCFGALDTVGTCICKGLDKITITKGDLSITVEDTDGNEEN